MKPHGSVRSQTGRNEAVARAAGRGGGASRVCARVHHFACSALAHGRVANLAQRGEPLTVDLRAFFAPSFALGECVEMTLSFAQPVGDVEEWQWRGAGAGRARRAPMDCSAVQLAPATIATFSVRPREQR